MVLCDSEGEESPTVMEHGAEGRASWPFSDAVFLVTKMRFTGTAAFPVGYCSNTTWVWKMSQI